MSDVGLVTAGLVFEYLVDNQSHAGSSPVKTTDDEPAWLVEWFKVARKLD